MEKKLHEKLIKEIATLKELVGQISWASLLNWVAMEVKKNAAEGIGTSKLISPVKQSFYLIGISLTSKEPHEPQPMNERYAEKLISSLNTIFHSYALMFWPTPDEKDRLTDEWHRCREVAMPVFLHYFNTL